MKDFHGKVAVVTGAASGIGRALAERFAAEGAKVVLADVEAARLASVEAALRASGAAALGVPTDVTRATDLERLAQATVATFGAVHILCNNAGVASPGAPSWEKPLEDWSYVLGVNLWGVIHGIHAFLPLLLRQGVEAHVVNTASAAGLLAVPGAADYLASKHAVVSISESLHLELEARKAPIKVSVVCPGFVRTGILDAVDQRSAGRARSSEEEAAAAEMKRLLAESTPPAEIAEAVLGAVREERFYVLPHAELKPHFRARLEAILEERAPRMEA